MKYYDIHDSIYKDLSKQGFVSWDRELDASALFEHSINQHLKQNLWRFFKKGIPHKALDLGTGAGTAALFLAQNGFMATGYDGSNHAIQMAKENAKTLNLNADFYAADLVHSEVDQNIPFDLVIDSSFLHCIVTPTDRQKIYALIKKSLHKHGFLFIHTMVQNQAMENNQKHEVFADKPFIIKDSTVWSSARSDWQLETHEINGKQMFPHRKILTTHALETEFTSMGFKIIHSQQVHKKKEPSLYVGWLQKE